MERKTIYALGFFDGVHLGHQALLRACRELAAETGCQAGAITFTSHPDALVSGSAPGLINSIEDRRRLLAGLGMERIAALPFDEKMMRTSWQAFFQRLVEEFGAAGLVCGYDFRFGAQGAGNALRLEGACREAGIPCRVVPEQRLDGVTVSSTHIRKLLAAGDMAAAGKFLGHPHILSGQVTGGRHLGRRLGTPTANIPAPPGVLLPRYGVYACKARVADRVYLAVTNVGIRPTVEGHHATVEPWLLDFSGDLYGKTVTLEFHGFIRPERRFGSLEALQAEIRKNADDTRNFFGKN